MKAEFTFEKETKNTVRFQEVTTEGNNPIIGPLYVQKSALAEMKYEEGKSIVIDINIK